MLCTCRFTDDEVVKLHDLYADYGSNWKLIGQLLNRSGPACRDKWRITRKELGTLLHVCICRNCVTRGKQDVLM